MPIGAALRCAVVTCICSCKNMTPYAYLQNIPLHSTLLVPGFTDTSTSLPFFGLHMCINMHRKASFSYLSHTA